MARRSEAHLQCPILTRSSPMCPLCIGSAALLFGSAGSAGGVAALTLRSIVRRHDRSQRLEPDGISQARRPRESSRSFGTAPEAQKSPRE
jgi:hypothetical protein